MRTTAAAACLLALAGCGGSGTGEPVQPPLERPASLMFVGNSISVHVPEPDIGWGLDCGMASTACGLDYVHQVASGLGASMTVENVAQLEESPDTYEAQIQTYAAGVTAQTAVVVEMGDDVPLTEHPAFERVYGELLAALQPRQSLACLSTWWADADTDSIIQTVCQAQGGRFVYIGDIFPNRTDTWPPTENRAIQKHPHDPSMGLIAGRVLAQFK